MENEKLYTITIKGREKPLFGIVESFSSNWILMKRISYNFVFDGFTLVQRRLIKSCRRNSENKLREKVLEAKGIMNMPVADIPLDDRLAPIKWLCNEKMVVEFHIDDESKFYVGRIDKVQTNSFCWMSIDNRGIWDHELSMLHLKNIAFIDIDSNYTSTLLDFSQTNVDMIGKLCSFDMKGWVETLSGVVCAVSPEWILIKEILDDFLFDGYALIRTKYIDLWNRDEGIPFRQEVLKHMGIIDTPIPDIPLDDLVHPIQWLAQQKKLPVFSLKKEEDEPFLGEIMEVKKQKVEFHSLNTEGAWESKTWSFPIDDVVVVEWDNDYGESLLTYNQFISGKIKTGD